MKTRLEEVHFTNEGLKIKIIEYFDCYNCTIEFEDGTILKNREYGDIKKGSIKNPNHKSVCNIGYLGEGKYKTSINKNRSQSYLCWKNILIRCYETEGYSPDYKNATVNKEWHNYQNFAKWWEENYIPDIMKGWHIDKDILLKGNKEYGPETCCFVPQEINALLVKCDTIRGKYPIGVCKRGRYFTSKISIGKGGIISKTFKTVEEAFINYKITKEAYITKMAEEYKVKLKKEVYEALLKYRVEITD